MTYYISSAPWWIMYALQEVEVLLILFPFYWTMYIGIFIISLFAGNETQTEYCNILISQNEY